MNDNESRPEPRWIGVEVTLAIHDRQLAEHGGGEGLRDAGLLESALSRPRNAWGYGEPDLADLAAAYAYGIARNHPFIDGNKRTAWMLARLFLRDNGQVLAFQKVDAVRTMMTLAAGDLPEHELAAWFRERIVER